MHTLSRTRIAGIASLGIMLAVFTLLCSFKILDRDFWWHITAGKMMWETGRLIAVEPFAFTREGLPYLATHEWLAQIVLFLVYKTGGPAGIILFRTVMMALTFGLLLFIDRRRVWPNALLAILPAAAAAPGFLERPQLFTFAILAGELLLITRYLSLDAPAPQSRRRWLLGGMLALQLLWVNMHGAAALVGGFLLGALFLQRVFSLWRGGDLQTTTARMELGTFVGAGVLAILLLLATPDGFNNIDYVVRLLTDKTIAFISEWRPREHGYLLYLGPVWLLAGIPLLLTRRDVVFSVLALGVPGYLSTQAFRHEMLFVIAATAICLHQLRYNRTWQRWLDGLLFRPVAAGLCSLALLLPVAAFAAHSYRQIVERDYLWGYGVFAPGEGAADFVEQQNIRGNMFNTYGIGGYLIHRFHPDRKVFIDGRNVDYGYEFMEEAFLAGHTPADWRKIEDKWKLTYALVDYDAIRQPGWLSYSRVLDHDPAWPLVYIDDWTAVYVKDIPQNKAVIDAYRYRTLSAEGLEFKTALNVSPERRGQLEDELRRAIAASPESVKARFLLGSLLLKEGRTEEVLPIAADIQRLMPQRPESATLRASVALARQDYATARTEFLTMLRLAGDDYPDINYALLAEVFENAGDTRRAAAFRMKAGLPAKPTSSPSSSSAAAVRAGSGMIDDILSGMQVDIETNNDEGIRLAEEGRFDEARDAFLRALMLDPGNPLTLSNLSALALHQNKLDEAIDYGTRALKRAPDFADAHFNLALAYMKAGNTEKAREHAEASTAAGRDASMILNMSAE